MEIFTSCFSFAKSLDASKFFVVSISRFPPRWFKGYKCKEFAPSASLLRRYRQGLSKEAYTSEFMSSVMESQDVHKVFEGLAVLACRRDIVLCCFEGEDEFCHRQLVASYVKSRWGYSIKELC